MPQYSKSNRREKIKTIIINDIHNLSDKKHKTQMTTDDHDWASNFSNELRYILNNAFDRTYSEPPRILYTISFAALLGRIATYDRSEITLRAKEHCFVKSWRNLL